MLKAIHAQEDCVAAREKAPAIAEKLETMKPRTAAKEIRKNIEETLTRQGFANTRHRQIRTNAPLERIMREIRRRSRGDGSLSYDPSNLMPVAAVVA
jgi:transposase-like protein